MLRRPGPLVFACALATLALAAEATATDQPQYTGAAGTLNAGVAGELAVACPLGTRAVGGSASLDGGTLESEIRSSAPFDGSDRDKAPDDGWIGSGSPGPTASETLSIDAICTTRKLTYASEKKELAPGTDRTLTPRCQKGSKAISGGVKTPNPFFVPSTDIVLMATFPTQTGSSDTALTRTWASTVGNDSTGKIKAKGWAICSKRSGSFQRTVEGPVNAGEQDSVTTAFNQSCSFNGAPFYVAGVGAHVSGGFVDTEIAGYRPWDLDTDGFRDDGVTAYMNNHRPGNLTMTGVHVCIPY